MSYFSEHYSDVRYPLASNTTKGLRRAQLGGIHAISSYFTRRTKPRKLSPAIVVMPTGSGKTAVLVLSPFVLSATRVLVVSPNKIINAQIDHDFQCLDLLTELGTLPANIPRPRVKILRKRVRSEQGWRDLLSYDVVIATPDIASPGEARGVVKPPNDLDLFDLLLMDEGHHEPAATWRSLLDTFPDAKKVLFTATPYRRDEKQISGTMIYDYSMKEAFEDGIITSIDFHGVKAEKENEDVVLAREAKRLLGQIRATGIYQSLLVRTDSKAHANRLEEVYQAEELHVKAVHSGISYDDIAETIRQLKDHVLDGVIAVQMLGEGFDVSTLKIGVIHKKHISLPATLQFIGRFVRTEGSEIVSRGQLLAIEDPELEIEREKLYLDGKVWSEIVPQLYQNRLEREQERQEVEENFEDLPIAYDRKPYSEEWSISSIKPSYHAKVYKLAEGARLDLTRSIGITGFEVLSPKLHRDQSTLVFVVKASRRPQWSKSRVFRETQYDLVIIHVSRQYVFVNSSTRNESIYGQVMQQIVTAGRYDPLPSSRLNKALLDLDSLEFFNIGMRNRLANSRSESYRIIAGSGAHLAIRRSDGRLFNQGHVFGRGTVEGQTVTVGYSSSSRVWSTTKHKQGIQGFIEWCESLAKRFESEREVSTQSDLDHLSVGSSLESLPPDLLFVDWHETIYGDGESNYFIEVVSSDGRYKFDLLDLQLSIKRINQRRNSSILVLSNYPVSISLIYNPLGFPWFRYEQTDGVRVSIQRGKANLTLEDFLAEYPLRIYTASGMIIGAQIYRTPDTYSTYDPNNILGWDWESNGVNIFKEYDKPNARTKDSIHSYLKTALPNIHELVFYDHGSGEIADFVCLSRLDNAIKISLYHVKKAGGSPQRSRVSDVYEVCGQAVKCLNWIKKPAMLRKRIQQRLKLRTKEFVKESGGLG
ncbi:MAG: DEAD/DEAH box helicase family protein [Chloroflexi bacterium]|uniref:DEAD/DEAH box helicase n=1 Tax=Candidatus Flexifilum breve TaxID=3140694 RepID=UPI003136C16F|nr:DEAD/DEAH box helicase family protein [Chloroflexota bacterium]